ncbi:MAG: acyl--CoA ligase [Desulfobacterales bacterium]|nr:acyl--CoA ligase [Desulfobacterales bacterium]
MINSEKQVERRIKEILSGPGDPKKDFTLSGHTYEDIYAMAAGLNASFSSMDFGDSPICLCSESKAVIAAALLAVLSDGPPLILPYAHSEHVLSEMHDLTGFRFAITDMEKGVPPGVEPLIPTQGNGLLSDISLKKDINPDRELLRLFTGGSTGNPKIWSKTLKNLFSEAIYLSKKYSISHNDRFVATVSPYHIYGLLFSVLIPLVSSAGVLDDICTFPDEIASAIEKNSATVLAAVPLHYRVLHSHSIPGSSLRLAFSSAGVLAESDGDAFFKQNGIGVVEIYGSTETGGIASRRRAKGEPGFTFFDNIAWKIIDERLYVKSEFISPEIKRDENGFFKTGDRAKLNDENSFLLLGRSDSVTKVGGKRVDLEEIRDKIKNVPGVGDSFVMSIPVQKGRENAIVAIVEGDTDKTYLRRSLSDSLEPYAIPRSIKIVDKIPTSASGKYDRKAIEEMFRTEFGNFSVSSS